MGIKFANNIKTTLGQSCLAGATSLYVVSTTGFPTLGVNDYFYATIAPADELDGSTREVVKVTAYVAGTGPVTVERGQDNTTPTAWSATDKFELRIPKVVLDETISATAANVVAAQAAQTAAEAAQTAAELAETNAETAETNAELAQTNAEAAQTAAEAAQTAAESVYDTFDDRFLGVKAADPTLDNDGNALLTGALYWNSVVPEMRIYTGAAWISIVSETIGKQSIWIGSAGILSRITTGPSVGITETATNKINIPTLDFDSGTQEYAQFSITMPKSWNEGTVTAKFVWGPQTATGNVIWGLQAVAVSDDDVQDAAFGTPQTVTDGVTATGDKMTSSETSAITIAGTPAAEDTVYFEVYRKAADAADTLNQDAKLQGVLLYYTTDAATDA
jgi:hypothetical protein